MIGIDFYFDNHSLSEFGMKMYDPESDQAFVTRTPITTDISANRPEQFIYGTAYDDTLLLPFFIVKDPYLYDTQSERKFSKSDISDIRRWLESAKHPKELRVESRIEDEDTEVICYFGIFTDVQPFIVNKECYGLYLNFKCNAPYGFSTERVIAVNFQTATIEKKNFYNGSDEKEEYLYPKIKVHVNTAVPNKGQLTIINHTDFNNTMKLNVPNTEYFVIDCKNKRVTLADGTLLTLADLGWTIGDAFDYTSLLPNAHNIYWIRFLYGLNELELSTPTGSVRKVEFITRFIRKADGF